MTQVSGQLELWRGAELEARSVDYPAGRANATAILAIAAGLMGLGAVMTFSATASPNHPIFTWDFWHSMSIRQLIFVVLGLIAMLTAAQVPYRFWTAYRGLPAMLLLAGALASTMLVFVPGLRYEAKGAVRWVQLGAGIRFQPSEIVKLSLPIFLATWIGCKVDIRNFWRGFVPAAAAIGLSVAAVGMEDFGTAALLAAVGGALLFVGGSRLWHLFLLLLPSIPAFALLLISRAHRMQRLTTFRNIWEDPEKKGYQAIQSLCTIASGGWWGRGLGRGYTKGYLPEARSDFIFSVICEELGVAGGVAVIGLFVLLLWHGRSVIKRCNNPMGQLLALAMTLTLGVQAVMNIAVVTVSVPTKGISLPLVSAGGSGVIFLGALVGVLANIAKQDPGPTVRAYPISKP